MANNFLAKIMVIFYNKNTMNKLALSMVSVIHQVLAVFTQQEIQMRFTNLFKIELTLRIKE